MQFFVNYPKYANIMGVYSGHHEKVKNSTFSRPVVREEVAVSGHREELQEISEVHWDLLILKLVGTLSNAA